MEILDLNNVDARFRVAGRFRDLLNKKLFDDETEESVFVQRLVSQFAEQQLQELMGIQGAPQGLSGDDVAFLKMLIESLSLDDIDALRQLAAKLCEPAAPAPKTIPQPQQPLDPAFLDPNIVETRPGPQAPPSVKVRPIAGPLTKPFPSREAMEGLTTVQAVENSAANQKGFNQKMRGS